MVTVKAKKAHINEFGHHKAEDTYQIDDVDHAKLLERQGIVEIVKDAPAADAAPKK